MALHPMDLMEPEETVGNLWHGVARRLAPVAGFAAHAVALDAVRPGVTLLFRALGGRHGVEIAASPATASRHRRGIGAGLAEARVLEHVATFDGAALRLPPVMDAFPTADLNRAAYLWLAAMAAAAEPYVVSGDARDHDLCHLAANEKATARTLALCPGLRAPHAAFCTHLLQAMPDLASSAGERSVWERARALLSGDPLPDTSPGPAARGYAPFPPLPIWLRMEHAPKGSAATPAEDAISAPPGLASPTRKQGKREDNEQANRTDSFIMHRFESIFSWVESMGLNRATDDDDLENAQKAAEDQDHITLSKHHKRAATRLRLHLDLAPQDADHERLADIFTYPEWNHRARAYMPDHTRVLEAEATPGDTFAPDPRLMARVRQQFEAMHPRRILLPRHVDGAELDLDALIAAQVAIRATGQGSDRIFRNLRNVERDLSVAILMDCSRSTESVVGSRSIIDTTREALAALAGGIDAAGDRLAIWGFSSLRRDRVFLTRCKGFAAPMTPEVTARIGGMRPGHYTRLGAAIRHASAQLAQETSARKLVLVLTDGKPNDLDHYEGTHGIEDSHMAVREARRAGQSVHGVIVDVDGQDWFARIFGRAGFTLLPDPARLGRALPDIYRSLTQET
ncbi:MAG: VWA domain-containing protein [Pseudotabrizicola sp.]|uniref:nitric oxide reductase activation protein NorD n=1 Tax=Pseudotabrizicola sp. TaxID=2939647 RepID=UPI002724F8C7|nr:VWA domain-containing protein [Pseudotabrizicola sp.]MDO8884353.1 VWA domain-containing protein [Pseudotabrizicola sp.]MDP2080266.1 VWA domain-containing protein [Pseudotabrizicola sp.]MDZ7575351.1 VWA domain-containing protein [Pseudotabrizicola sp.]